MRVALDAFRNDTESVVFSERIAADTPEQALLNALLELNDSNTRGRSGDLDRDLADGEPWDGNADRNVRFFKF